jgi:uncharacterized membrane protein
VKLRLIKLRDTLADSFWFLPALMAVLAAGLALGSVAFDHTIGSGWVRNIGWVWSGGPDGARSVLTVISGSVMTVASIVFSLTITTLAQTSAHYGPRVLRNFTSDRGVQFTLGTFIATFVYSLLVLRTVRSVQESAFVPYLSVTIGIVLALMSLSVLIFFIHHVSQNIQAENLIAEAGQAFQEMVTTFFPERIGEVGQSKVIGEADWTDAREIRSNANGYLQRIDDDALVNLALRHDVKLKVDRRPGHFVPLDSVILWVLPPVNVNDAVADALRECFSQGTHRTPYQDALYSLQQLAEIAAHALSPGINEPFTAVTCIDWLGSSLRSVARRDLPAAERYDKNGDLRLIVPPLRFDELLHAAFDQIRIYGASNPDVVLSLSEAIAGISSAVHRKTDREALGRYLNLIAADAAQVSNAADRERVCEYLGRTSRALKSVA